MFTVALLVGSLLFGSLLVGSLLVGCAGRPVPSSAVPAPTGSTGASPSDPPATDGADPEPVRQGRPARPEQAFTPAAIELPGDHRAPVVAARTVNGVLEVPEHVRKVGWWDGSARAGDPFGSTVIAGHIDSATEGIGFFAELLRLRVGQHIVLRSGEHESGPARSARYRISSVRTVAKDALARDSEAFEQDGDHRLVLITCAGAYLPERGGYQSNFVVIAEPSS